MRIMWQPLEAAMTVDDWLIVNQSEERRRMVAMDKDSHDLWLFLTLKSTALRALRETIDRALSAQLKLAKRLH